MATLARPTQNCRLQYCAVLSSSSFSLVSGSVKYGRRSKGSRVSTEIASLKMKELRLRLQSRDVTVPSRVIKLDFQCALSNSLKTMSSSGTIAGPQPELKKAFVVLPFYLETGSLASVTTSNSKLQTNNLRKAPASFDQNHIVKHLINSPGK